MFYKLLYMVIRNKFDCPWCSKTEKAFAGDGGEYALK
jgi:glutaredoxin